MSHQTKLDPPATTGPAFTSTSGLHAKDMYGSLAGGVPADRLRAQGEYTGSSISAAQHSSQQNWMAEACKHLTLESSCDRIREGKRPGTRLELHLHSSHRSSVAVKVSMLSVAQ